MRPGLFCPQRYCSALKGAIFVIMPYCALCWALFLCHFAFLSLHTPGHPCAHLPVFLLVALVAYRSLLHVFGCFLHMPLTLLGERLLQMLLLVPRIPRRGALGYAAVFLLYSF